MFLLVGLGNPGKQYQNTRHNFGFLAIDQIIADYDLSVSSNKFDSEIFSGIIDGQKIIAAKPQTFMNCSGAAVQKIMNFYKIPLDKLIVFHDDLDIALGRIKTKIGGGNGGHNGLGDLDQVIGADYLRVRLGIGRPENKEYDTANYVLGNFNLDELKIVEAVNKKIAKLTPLILAGKINDFSNQFYL